MMWILRVLEVGDFTVSTYHPHKLVWHGRCMVPNAGDFATRGRSGAVDGESSTPVTTAAAQGGWRNVLWNCWEAVFLTWTNMAEMMHMLKTAKVQLTIVSEI